MTDVKWRMTNKSFSESLDRDNLRILLWDLDGTLVRGARYGIFKDYTVPMLESVFGTAGCLPEMIVSGMTDLQIVEEALRDEGITREHISAKKDELLSCYIKEMKRATGNGDHVITAMPGARQVLEAVDAHPRYLSALLTGNIEPAAYLKVEITGLAEFFQLPGAFGNESFDRSDLPGLAAERINKHLQANLSTDQFIVIGDTPNDVACARHFGARVVALATSRIYATEELRACNPDALLPDLLDLDLFMKTLAKL
ncbi:MAG TPA: HAD family hydrolase [Pyrinomonadaceae bacterium]|jgi:phosphoglycolate phosphatase-like HAD superfamily hydrolase|nr:HAD family hydrolase [Pyrinomonadaceae bacterium]